MKIEMETLDRDEAHNLLGSILVPRPVTLISTIGEDGSYNAAPFSAVNSVCNKPPIFCVSIGLQRGEKKDTARNIEFSEDFVVNLLEESFIQKTIQTSADYLSGVDEAKEVGLTPIASDRVKAPRIAEAYASLECKLERKIELGEGANLREVIFGEVLMAHIKSTFLVRGKIAPSQIRVIGRMGTNLYAYSGEIFEMRATRPAQTKGVRE